MSAYNSDHRKRNCVHFHDNCGNHANIGNYSQMCNDQASIDDREAGANTCISQDESQNGICGEYRRQWHKYLPPTVLNHYTSYHASIGCEPTRVFHGRLPYNILDHKLGINQNEQITPTTEFAEEIQNRTELLIDKTHQNIMHSHLKYK